MCEASQETPRKANRTEVITTELTLDVTVIKGFAFDADGVTPLSATSVFLTPFGTSDQSETTTYAQGFFAFFNFEEGHYELFTSSCGRDSERMRWCQKQRARSL